MKTKIELTANQEVKLAKIYAKYMGCIMYDSNGLAQFESREEYVMEKKAIIKKFEKEFPFLHEKGITLQQVPILIYSENQLQFIEDLEGYMEIDYGYSGRGMFGNTCPAIRCEDIREVQVRTQAEFFTDNMGFDFVAYARY